MSIANKKRIRKITNGVILPEGSVVDSLNGNSSISAPSVKAVKEAVANASGVYLDEDKTNLYLNTDGFNSTLTSDDLKGSIQGLPIGSIIEWSSLTPPTNYLICDGSWVSQTTYADLYAVIGHTYDGDTSVEGSFRLPNRCGKVGVGYDADNTNFNALGKTGGEETHTLVEAEMPKHYHNWAFNKSGNPSTTFPKWTFMIPEYNQLESAEASKLTGSTTTAGNDQAHNNLQPYETTIFVIKYKDGNMLSDEYGGVVVDNLNSTSTKDALSAYQGKVLNDTKKDVFTYSTNEQWTGEYWIDGKKIYTKTLNIGALPNNNVKTMDLGYAATDVCVIDFKGFARGSSGLTLFFPHSAGNTQEPIQVYFNADGQVAVRTYNDRSAFTSYVTVKYIKINE